MIRVYTNQATTACDQNSILEEKASQAILMTKGQGGKCSELSCNQSNKFQCARHLWRLIISCFLSNI